MLQGPWCVRHKPAADAGFFLLITVPGPGARSRALATIGEIISMAGNKLSGEVKAFIVQHLARFNPPSAVARAVSTQFGETVTRQTVQCYDPHQRAGAKLSPQWRRLFDDTRRAFIEETSRIGMSHLAVRLQRLEAQFELAEERGDADMVLKLVKQAAMDVGGVFTRRGGHAAPGGIPAARRPPVSNRERAKAILLKLARARRERGEE